MKEIPEEVDRRLALERQCEELRKAIKVCLPQEPSACREDIFNAIKEFIDRETHRS